MDTTETYIKMCNCKEIQERYNPDEFSFLFDYTLKDNYGDKRYIGTREYNIPQLPKIQQVFVAYDGYEWLCIWLPRQDQLQEMVIGKGVLVGDWLDILDHFVMSEGGLFDFFDEHRIGETYNYTKSMEQLWLAFVMKEKYNKIWNGEDWISPLK